MSLAPGLGPLRTVGVSAAILDDDRRILSVRRAYPPQFVDVFDEER